MERANNFDLLRLGAAVSVIFSHAFLIGEGRQDNEPLSMLIGGQAVSGVAGVFVFFVISGFLVTQSFEATRSTPRFLTKRALRIYPGLLACLLVCAFGLGPLVSELAAAEYFRRPQVYEFIARNLAMDTDHTRSAGPPSAPASAGSALEARPAWQSAG